MSKNLNPLYEAVKVLSSYYPKPGKLKRILTPISAKKMQQKRSEIAKAIREKTGTPMSMDPRHVDYGEVYSRKLAAAEATPNKWAALRKLEK